MSNPIAQMLIINEELIPTEGPQKVIAIGSSFMLPEDFKECSEANDEFIGLFGQLLSNGLSAFLSVVADTHALPMEKQEVVKASPSISKLILEFLEKAVSELGVSFSKENVLHIGFFFEEGIDCINLTFALTDFVNGEHVSIAAIEAVVNVIKKLPGEDGPMVIPANPMVH